MRAEVNVRRRVRKDRIDFVLYVVALVRLVTLLEDKMGKIRSVVHPKLDCSVVVGEEDDWVEKTREKLVLVDEGTDVVIGISVVTAVEIDDLEED